ncbi:beta-phosphoglucomutase [Paenibacillus sp. 79R4]|uniref:beta-phosphoglucomutase n=1 Tax=Paenibacillus sp. 79R4 TaxID=2212847 RepID=UPI0015BEC42F|nr:beta-phosphoglucomutase [Paenibacillus sp. 79R4]NWL86178.1 beta-phosphoglucomutase [Paenibacillus sp. 79R4]
MLNIKGVIFDLDGVITDTAEFHFLAWKQLGEELGIPVNKELNEQLKGISRIESLEKILESGGRAGSNTANEKIELAARKNGYYLRLIDSITPSDILPGVEALLQELRQAGIRTGLASASHNAPFILDRLGLSHDFDIMVDPGEIGRGKPDPEIFLTAAHLLQLSPDSCMGIEDAAAGVEAINRAGMHSIGVGDRAVLSHANYVVESLLGLRLQDLG